jgi:protein phosphatase
MMVIFGGRGADGQPLGDTWGLRKHRDNSLDWMKAPYRGTSPKPTERYQHRTLFVGSLLMVVGGRNNNIGESMSLDVYDT